MGVIEHDAWHTIWCVRIEYGACAKSITHAQTLWRMQKIYGFRIGFRFRIEFRFGFWIHSLPIFVSIIVRFVKF